MRNPGWLVMALVCLGCGNTDVEGLRGFAEAVERGDAKTWEEECGEALAPAGSWQPENADAPHLEQGILVGEVTPAGALLQARLTAGVQREEVIRDDVPGRPGVARFEIARCDDFSDSLFSPRVSVSSPRMSTFTRGSGRRRAWSNRASSAFPAAPACCVSLARSSSGPAVSPQPMRVTRASAASVLVQFMGSSQWLCPGGCPSRRAVFRKSARRSN